MMPPTVHSPEPDVIDLQRQLLEAYYNGLITESEYVRLAQGSLDLEEDQGPQLPAGSMVE